MSQFLSAAPFTDADYEMIASAVLETARGRWFLSEHARRNRNADTLLVLEAVEKLERSIAQRTGAPETDRIRLELAEMADAIARTKAEIAAIKPGYGSGQIIEASNELDSIVAATERATSDILAATERFQEIGHALREQGTNSAICDLIDSNTGDIYAACTFQDVTSQRIGKVIEVLRFLEARIDSMIGILGVEESDRRVAAGDASIPRIYSRESSSRMLQERVDEIINGGRPLDVVWRDTSRTAAAPAKIAVDDIDEDNLLAFEDAPPAVPEAPVSTRYAESMRGPEPVERAAYAGPERTVMVEAVDPVEALRARAAEAPVADTREQLATPPAADPQSAGVRGEALPEEQAATDHPGSGAGIATLTLTERMALFS